MVKVSSCLKWKTTENIFLGCTVSSIHAVGSYSYISSYRTTCWANCPTPPRRLEAAPRRMQAKSNATSAGKQAAHQVKVKALLTQPQKTRSKLVQYECNEPGRCLVRPIISSSSITYYSVFDNGTGGVLCR